MYYFHCSISNLSSYKLSSIKLFKYLSFCLLSVKIFVCYLYKPTTKYNYLRKKTASTHSEVYGLNIK